MAMAMVMVIVTAMEMAIVMAMVYIWMRQLCFCWASYCASITRFAPSNSSSFSPSVLPLPLVEMIKIHHISNPIYTRA